MSAAAGEVFVGACATRTRVLRGGNRSATRRGVCDGWQSAYPVCIPYFPDQPGCGGGISSLRPPIRPPLLPNVFNEVEEEDE